jgi:hypothetical protein
MQFDDRQAREILARAVDLDLRTRTSADELRAIAREAGISKTAIDRAIEELSTELELRRTGRGRRITTAIAAMGVPAGVASAALLATSGPLQAMAALGIVVAGLVGSGALVVLPGSTGTLRSFHLKNLALWGGVAAGGAATIIVSAGAASPVLGLVLAGWCLRSWVASSIMGSAAMIAIRRARRGDVETSNDDDARSATGHTKGLMRLVRRAFDWLRGSARFTPLALSLRAVRRATLDRADVRAAL